MLLFKKIKLTRDPCKIGLLRATFYIQFRVHFEPFNLMYRSLITLYMKKPFLPTKLAECFTRNLNTLDHLVIR
jgi:hypothetical protein